jgi:hypothetical protein
MKPIPFYANHEDNHHCMLAVYRSVFDYFYDEKISWAELEALTGYEPKKAAWSLTIISYLTKRGMNIRMIEPFDYVRYYAIGESYLEEFFPSAEKDWQLEHGNILEIRPLIPDFLERVKYELKKPTLEDIDSMLVEDRLVIVTLDSRVLNDKPGYFSHAVLVIKDAGDHYIIHDPGLPPQPSRHVSKQKLYAAMGGEKTTSEVTGFRLNKD